MYQRRGRDELKTIDTGTQSTSAAAVGSVILLNGVGQGTDYTNRIGRRILLKSLLLRFNITTIPSTSDPAGDFIRILVVYDAQTNAVTPAVTDIINGDFLSPLNLSSRDRFKVLSDKTTTMNPNGYTAGAVSGGSPRNVAYKIYKKMSMEEIFGGTGATVGSIQTGAIFLLIISAANGASAVNWNSRIRFIDS